MKALSLKTKTTHYIEWLTYAHTIGAGLGEFLALHSECPTREVELLESPNDTDYTISVSKENVADDSFYMQYNHDRITKDINSGEVACSKLPAVFCWLLFHNLIEEGDYVVKMSW